MIFNCSIGINQIAACLSFLGAGGGGGGAAVNKFNARYISQIFTSIEYSDRAIFGYILESHTVSSLDECIERCSDHRERCNSFNYEKTNSIMARFKCELNTMGMAVNRIAVKFRRDFQLYDVYWGDEKLLL